MMKRIKKLVGRGTGKSDNGHSVVSASIDEKSEVSRSSAVDGANAASAVRQMMGYYIGPTLGQGHFARVKLGVHTETGDKVALKLILKDAIEEDSPEFRSVRREVDALSLVQHENVLRLHEVQWSAMYPKGNDKFENVSAIVLELAEGGELFDFLCYCGAMSEVVARSYFHQLIQGLEACHNQGVIHRDLKLENVLLNNDFILKIADFGLSELNVFNDRTKMNIWCGTKRYMAPELHENRRYTLKVDTFACGIILFVLLAGYPPFVYATREDELYKYIHSGNINGFWRKHASYDKATFSNEAKELLNGMLAYAEDQRWTLQQVKESAFYNGEVLTREQLKEELAARKAVIEESKKKGKPKEKKESKLDRLDTDANDKHRAFFNESATTAGDAEFQPTAEPELWDDEEMGIQIFSQFSSKNEATDLLNKMKNLLSSMRHKHSVNDNEYTIEATCEDPETAELGEVERVTVWIKVYQAPEPDLRYVLMRRMEGDAFVFRRFYDEFTDYMGKAVFN